MQTSSAPLRLAITCGVLVLLAMLCGCSTLGTKPPHATNLSGDWTLNESLSEDPLAQLREQRHSRGGGMHRRGGMPGGGMPGGGMPGGGMRRGNWPGGEGMPSQQRRQGPLGDFVTRAQEIDIKQSARELDLNADGAATEFVYGEKVMASVQGGTAERVSGWKGGAFVVKYAVADGPTATRSFQLADSGRQLIVTTHVEGARERKFEYRTVYERKAKAG